MTQLADRLTTADGDLEVVSCREGWTDEGRHEARLVVRRATR